MSLDIVYGVVNPLGCVSPPLCVRLVPLKYKTCYQKTGAIFMIIIGEPK